jgi:type IV secretion system protein VirD4
LQPSDHKARWFAAAALNSAEQAMASAPSTAPSSLKAFLDSEMEQFMCFETANDYLIIKFTWWTWNAKN